MTAQDVIQKLGLIPLEREGGMVRQTYVSRHTLADGQSAGTAIYYLLSGDAFSHLHRLHGDELYHFYLGDPVELLELLPDGSSRTTILGPDLENGQVVQHLVPGGNWQGSHLREMKKGNDGWALLGTTMCPGYTDTEYEHGNRDALLTHYPEADFLIRKLTDEPV